VLAIGVLVKSTANYKNDKIFEAIINYTENGKWELPKKSKYFTYNYPEGSKMKLYSESSGWPGDLTKGFGKEYLTNLLNLANKISGNKFNEIRINRDWKKDAINIYFFNSDQTSPFDVYKGNCAYLGFNNIVVCDVNFIWELGLISNLEAELDSTLDGRHFSTVLDKNRSFRKLALLRQLGPLHNVLLWIIGHEIGHIAKGHKVGHFVHDEKFSEIMQGKNFDDSLESEADQFALDAFGNSEVTADFFWAINEMIAFEINKELSLNAKELNAQLKDFDHPLSIRARSKTHPPLLKRLLNFGVAINHTIPFNSEYLDRINNNLTVIK
jgi:hypothetical protein